MNFKKGKVQLSSIIKQLKEHHDLVGHYKQLFIVATVGISCICVCAVYLP